MIRQTTGLLFGSFNPIHIGHLAIANYISEYHQLEEVWFVVTPQSPLKNKATLLPARHRLEMVRLAIAPHPQFKLCEVEFSLPQPNYTIHTLDTLRDQFPERQFYLLIGADNWQQLPQWKSHDRLCAEYPLLIYPRIGYEAAVPAGNAPNVQLAAAPRMEISASLIREALFLNKKVSCFVPEAVWRYIEKHHLYKQRMD